MTDAIQQPKNETSCLKREFVYIEICGGGGGAAFGDTLLTSCVSSDVFLVSRNMVN